MASKKTVPNARTTRKAAGADGANRDAISPQMLNRRNLSEIATEITRAQNLVISVICNPNGGPDADGAVDDFHEALGILTAVRAQLEVAAQGGGQ